MKAISLHQPYATFIALRWKTIETRTHNRFRNLEGETIAIHAAKKVYFPAYTECVYSRGLNGLELQNVMIWANRCRGHIVCTAKVVKCRWAPNIGFGLHEEWNKQAMCEVGGKYLIFLDQIEPLVKPEPCRGRQGIFDVSVG